MKLIKKLSGFVEEELDGAYEYAECALKHKESDPMLAKVFYDLSVAEMNHVNMLHDEVVRQISNYRNEGHEVPEAMQAVYDYLHEKHIDSANEIKILQMSFRGN